MQSVMHPAKLATVDVDSCFMKEGDPTFKSQMSA